MGKIPYKFRHFSWRRLLIVYNVIVVSSLTASSRHPVKFSPAKLSPFEVGDNQTWGRFDAGVKGGQSVGSVPVKLSPWSFESDNLTG